MGDLHMTDVDIRPINPAILPQPSGAYTHGTVVIGGRRTVFVSGQVPWAENGQVPEDFASQCRLTWRNVLAVLADAGMGVKNLAKVTTYLSDRQYRASPVASRPKPCGSRVDGTHDPHGRPATPP
jgi:2-iminobutanoate/2-iminopropanoate deaminase